MHMQNNLLDSFRKINFILWILMISIFISGCNTEGKKRDSTKANDDIEEIEDVKNNTVFDIKNVLVDGYSINDMVICDNNLIAAYSANSENMKIMSMLRCYDLDTFELLKEKRVDKITTSSELVSYDHYFYLNNDSIDSSLICYDSNLNVVKKIEITNIGAMIAAYNPISDEVVYTKRSTDNFSLIYLCKNNSELSNEEHILEINQANSGGLYSIDKIYCSNDGSKIGFLGQSFQSFELNSLSKTVYGIIDLETKNIDMKYRENIDTAMHRGNMLVHYIDGYQSESSKKDRTVILDLDNKNEKTYDTNLTSANLEFSMSGKNNFIVVGSDLNNSCSSIIMKYYDDNGEHVYTQDSGLFMDGSTKYVGVYSQKKNILYIYYQIYNDSEQKLYQYIKEVNV